MTGQGRAAILSVIAAVIVIAAGVGFWPRSPMEPSPGTTMDADAGGADLAAVLSALDIPEAGSSPAPWTLSLPRDFGPQDDAGAETWSVSAHLEDDAGRPVSVNIVLLRLGVPDADGAAPWGPTPIHLAQVSLVSPAPDLRGSDQRVSRAAGTAGHDRPTGTFWLDDWTWAHDETGLSLSLRVGDRPLTLRLDQRKTALASDAAATARGFAIPRMAATGSFGQGADALRLSGTVWVDRLWGAVPLPGGPLIRDRLVLHLDDGSDLSLLRTRRRDGRGIATVDGVLVMPDGSTRAFDDATVSLTPAAAVADGAVPGTWRIEGEGLDLQATVQDATRQEPFGQPAMIGRVVVLGTRDGQPVEGSGTALFAAKGTS